jgi:uncharacterized protein with PIN domain
LIEAPATSVSNRVPPYVAAHVGRFLVCEQCRHVYWSGTHPGRIVERLALLFGQPDTLKQP